MCADIPHLALMLDFDRSWGYKLAPLLDAGIPVLIYNGNQDYICNWYGGLMWTNALVWEGQMEYKRAAFTEWLSEEGHIAGRIKNARNLTFMEVYDAGHMVPMD